MAGDRFLRKNEFFFWCGIGRIDFLIVENVNRDCPINFNWLFVLVVKENSTAKPALTRLAFLVLNGFGPYSHDLVRQRRGLCFRPSERLIDFDRLTASGHRRDEYSD